MKIKEKIKELGLELPEPTKPGGNYVSVNIRGNIAYIAIQFPIKNEEQFYKGRLGKELKTEDGYNALQLSALNVISQIEYKVGFDRILGLNHLDIYYQCSPDWEEAPIAANGASDLFVNILGEKGLHSRSIFGVENLPRNFCAGLTANFTLL